CRRRGLIVLTDRYPQDQIPGAYDGTVFSPNVEGGRFVSWLASQERKAFHWMASHKPDLVIKLNVDLELALMQGYASPLRSPGPSFPSAVIFRSFTRSDF
ncbi:hypothetical protein NE471_27455, partial [Escherichia coli]|nr:hypothetical protein [Escherichia coli]